MKSFEVDGRVAAIAEAAKCKTSCTPHELQDELYLDVLKAIANGAANPRELAAAAIKVSELNFPRWCE